MADIFCGHTNPHAWHRLGIDSECLGVGRLTQVERDGSVVIENGMPVEDTMTYDPVKIPQHYVGGKIEVANFIADQELSYPKDNIVKYVCRAGKKYPEKELEDLEKAAAYLQMAYNIANGLPAVVRDPETNEVVWTLFKN